MSALRKEQIAMPEMVVLLNKMTSDTSVLQSFIAEKDTTDFLRKIDVQLSQEEKETLQALREEILKTVNQNIMTLSEKISKITNKRLLCNGTCW
ncbi:MAG: hypothetical protein IKH28_10460 [Lachnospiraceae bacterium]|nr:hypothetical protein [Lachnospiraceae bacterium]